MPGIQQDVAVVAVHKKEEGIAVVEVDLIVLGNLLQGDDAIEDGDGLAVAHHRHDVAHHQLFRRKVACHAVGDVRAPRRLCFKIECAGNVVAGAVGQQQRAVGSQQRDGGDKGLTEAEGFHDAQHRVIVTLVMPRDQLRHGGEDGLVRVRRVGKILCDLARRGSQFIKGALCDLTIRPPDEEKDGTEEQHAGQERDRHHHAYSFLVDHVHFSFILPPCRAPPGCAGRIPLRARAGRARNKSPE